MQKIKSEYVKIKYRGIESNAIQTGYKTKDNKIIVDTMIVTGKYKGETFTNR